MKKKMTGWFPPHIKPVRVGLYQRDWGIQAFTDDLDWWDGRDWRVFYADGNFGVGMSCKLQWRGLAEDPRGQK